MITRDKVTEFFCTIDEFDKNLNKKLKKSLRLPSHASSAYVFLRGKGSNLLTAKLIQPMIPNGGH